MRFPAMATSLTGDCCLKLKFNMVKLKFVKELLGFAPHWPNLTIPDSVTHIGDGAFHGCSSLVKVTIPDSVTHIGDCAFLGCTSLAALTISNSVTRIGVLTFAGCSSLVNLTIPNSVDNIQPEAFSNCTSLVNVTIPDSVTYIGSCAFAGCTSLASLTIPDSVTYILDDAFEGCTSLVVRVPTSNTKFSMRTLQGCQRIIAKECHCHECACLWFLKGWVCPQQWRCQQRPAIG
ncbi:unnamed protein product [Durusdinium trenchii]|uniref:Surface antigen-like protein n=1 Tax=Durusdinium trenchii TaxID=1381693 RepID=A0ABP0LA73_9DINO